jgi:sodium/potassium/calcium exchanger 6
VYKRCPPSDTILSIPYLHGYFCSKPAVRPFIFTSLIAWLVFLFSTLGISAADFFTPNLATLAELLGLDEDVAGVTFLAFGNGSPDLFSTYSAMRAQSGSLAIGELLGAASFIVSCVVGSMCIAKPFKVERSPFLRDVGFFTVAVSLLLLTLWDGKLLRWEASVLIGLYVLYVFVVVVGSWWDRRRERDRRTELDIRSEYADDGVPNAILFSEPYRDDREPLSSFVYMLSLILVSLKRAHLRNPARCRCRHPSGSARHLVPALRVWH